MQYQKELQFYNTYTHKEDNLTLEWDFDDGFDDLDSAKLALMAAHQEPENFLYIKHHGFLYPVIARLMDKLLVFSQNFVWYRDVSNGNIIRLKRDNLTFLPYSITRMKSYHYYKNTMCLDLSEFDPNMTLIPGSNIKKIDRIYKNFCVASLGAVMVTSQIPSYQLCCMHIYLHDISPLLNLWAQGVKSYNPFSGQKELAPYSLKSYLMDSHDLLAEVDNFTYIRDVLINMGALTDTPTHKHLKIPFSFGPKLVYALEMLLSDLAVIASNANDSTLKGNDCDLENDSLVCRVCHTELPNDFIDNICPICKEQELLDSVKNYIREKTVTEQEVADYFQIPLYKVRRWVREGRIAHKDDSEEANT